MNAKLPQVIDRLRLPEYTGENRCTPCTLVNVTIAVVLGAAVGVVSLPVGAGVFVLSLVAIYLRGYLVPGTPQLTKRYFPDWVLRYFETHEGAGTYASATTRTSDAEGTVESDVGDDVEPEAVLAAAGVIEPCESVDDLCLEDSFRGAWHEEMERVEGTDAKERALGDILDVDESELEFEEHDAAFLARLDGRRIGQWESNAALVADLAAAHVLRERYPDWDALTVQSQSRVLNGLRIFLDECPECGGTVVPDQETVESCCRSIDVVAATCDDCDVRILEVEQEQ